MNLRRPYAYIRNEFIKFVDKHTSWKIIMSGSLIVYAITIESRLLPRRYYKSIDYDHGYPFMLACGNDFNFHNDVNFVVSVENTIKSDDCTLYYVISTTGYVGWVYSWDFKKVQDT